MKHNQFILSLFYIIFISLIAVFGYLNIELIAKFIFDIVTYRVKGEFFPHFYLDFFNNDFNGVLFFMKWVTCFIVILIPLALLYVLLKLLKSNHYEHLVDMKVFLICALLFTVITAFTLYVLS